MKKGILLLTGLGIGAGVFYAIGARRDTGVDTKSNGKHNDSELTDTSGNGRDRSAGELSVKSMGFDDHDQKSSMGRIENNGATAEKEPSEASQILKHLRDAAFDSSNENLALALGRPVEEIEEEIGGQSPIDGDELMKVRKLAMERGVEL
jgi:hypothetical protein